MANEYDISSFSKIAISALRKFAEEIPFSTYVKLSESKVVKISNDNSSIQDLLTNYETKGLTDLYVHKDDFKNFIQKIGDSKYIDGENRRQIKGINDCFLVFKEIINKMGINEEIANMAHHINIQSCQIIENSPNISNFFKDFQHQCNDEFLLSTLSAHTTSCMIDHFSWTTESIKKKTSLASLLCDILLQPEDFAEIKKHDNQVGQLSKKILNHPIETVNLLKKESDSFSSETFLIIEQHHEKPDGSGFPGHLMPDKISQLAAITIIAREFIEQLIKNDFNYQKRDTIMDNLAQKYRRGNYQKAMQSLQKLINY